MYFYLKGGFFMSHQLFRKKSVLDIQNQDFYHKGSLKVDCLLGVSGDYFIEGDLYLYKDIFLIDGSLHVTGNIYFSSNAHTIVIIHGNLSSSYFLPQHSAFKDSCQVTIDIRHGDIFTKISCYKKNFHISIEK